MQPYVIGREQKMYECVSYLHILVYVAVQSFNPSKFVSMVVCLSVCLSV